MIQRKQDDLTKKFLFALMSDMMDEEAEEIRRPATAEERTTTEIGHMDASLSLLTKVASESNALEEPPATTEGWAKNVLERVDALPKEAKPVGIRRVAKRRVKRDLPAQVHGHQEINPVPAPRARKMRTRATRTKSVLRQ
jgi:hypothetical protein